MKYLTYFIFYAALAPLLFSTSCNDDITPEVGPPMMEEEPLAINAAIDFPNGPFFNDCPISMTGTAIAGAIFEWEVSDGQSFSGSNISINFDAPGNYAVTLKARFDGRTEEVMRTITVRDQQTNTFITYEDDSFTQLIGVKSLPNGEFVTVGSFCKETFNLGSCKIQGVMVRWHDSDGTVVKKYKSSNGTESYSPRAFTVLSNGEVAVAVSARKFDPNGYEVILLKFDREVGISYLKRKTTIGKDMIPMSVAESYDTRVVVGGVSFESSGGDQNSVMIVFRGPSNPEVTSFDGPGTRTGIHSIVMLEDGEYFGLADLAGGVSLAISSDQTFKNLSSSGFSPVSIEKGISAPLLTVVAKPGQIRMKEMNEWGTVLDAAEIDLPDVTVRGSSIISNGNILICGMQRAGDGNYGYLAEVNMRQEIIWEKRYNDFGGNIQGAAESPDCGFVTAGYITNGSGSRDRAYFQKTKPEGEL